MVRTLPQADHADLGIVPDSDFTEDLRQNQTAPVDPVFAAPAGTVRTHTPRKQQVLHMMTHNPMPTTSTDRALALDQAVNMVDVVRRDLNEAMRRMPDAPLFAAVDLVTALAHLKQAAVFIDKAADAIAPRQAAADADDAWADQDWQVDSTTRPCCSGIGSHTQECRHDANEVR